MLPLTLTRMHSETFHVVYARYIKHDPFNCNFVDSLTLLFKKKKTNKKQPEVFMLRGFQIDLLVFLYNKMSVEFNTMLGLLLGLEFFL